MALDHGNLSAMKFDLSLMGIPLEQIPARAMEMRALGADGLFAAEGPHDVFAPLYLAAAGSPGVPLMTNAAIVFPRNPVHLAHAAFDLQRLCQGEFRLGVAPQVAAHITRRFGLEWSRPVSRMTDLVAALRAIFDTWQHGVALDYVGPYYQHRLMTPMFSPPPLASGPPKVIVGALGPAMTEMAAREADGVSILPFSTAALLEQTTLPAIERGLEASGRSREAIEVVAGAIVAVGGDAEELAAARSGARALIGFYGSTAGYRRVLESVGRGDLYEPLSTRVRAGDFGALAELIDDHLLESVAIVGEPEDVAARLQRRFGPVADRVAIFLPSQPSDATLRTLFDHLASS